MQIYQKYLDACREGECPYFKKHDGMTYIKDWVSCENPNLPKPEDIVFVGNEKFPEVCPLEEEDFSVLNDKELFLKFEQILITCYRQR